MFLRKLTVIVVPLALGWLLCVVFPLLSGLGFWSNVLKGLLLGAGLALLLTLTVGYQYLHSIDAASVPMLNILATTDGQVVLVECVLVGYMALQSLRTRK